MVKCINLLTLLGTTLMMSGSTFAKYYNEKDILKETGWKGLGVMENAPNHLSILSQGRYDESKGKYDTNFYFPKSAGKDIDIFVFDIGFNFTYNDFVNTNERKIECSIVIKDGEVFEEHSKACYSKTILDHGTWAAATSAGMVNGIASRANIYGAVRYNTENYLDPAIDLLAFLKYVKDNLFRKGKAVFNLSVEFYYAKEDFEKNETIKEIQKLINEMSSQGAVFIASAGNDNSDTGFVSYSEKFLTDNPAYAFFMGKSILPCNLDNVICVGGVANMDLEYAGISYTNPPPYSDDMKSSNYQFRNNDMGSNYGPQVDLYAPFDIHYTGSSKHLSYYFNRAVVKYFDTSYDIVDLGNGVEYIENFDALLSGTSFSAPLTSGVAAAIMSEFPKERFNSTSMLQYLVAISQKDIIKDLPDGSYNYFLNIGKTSLYTPEDEDDSDDDEEVVISDLENLKEVDDESDSDDEQ
ncbi:hypothetical protein PIROE2DRAFT_10491 [Piromyces sp. E2]|nr:hypothetical protein PIROE2DRAFT_10491 [Piromyces sp. E2]|eukprot:OUM63075.1 hypothetical protein PIROE2DRAFT_10491 [Piromyces sp. E2]